jgi:predicted amidohydrolase
MATRLALIQMCSTADKARNLATLSRLIRTAASRNAKFVCGPESFDYVGPGEPEPLSGPMIAGLCALARSERVWLSLGGFHELPPGQSSAGKINNTHVVIDDGGSVRAVYRKLHLFDASVDGGWCVPSVLRAHAPRRRKESDTTSPGEQLVVVQNTPVGTVGLTTCYDVRFPEQYLALAQAGAQVILVPSAFMPTTGQAHWHTLLRARAIENQVYICAAAQAGVHSERRSSFGHSLAVDPFGKVLLDLGQEGLEQVATCEVDVDLLREVRGRMDMQASRRRVMGVLGLDALGTVSTL